MAIVGSLEGNILTSYKNFFRLILAVAILISFGSASAAVKYEVSKIPLERNGYNLYLSKLQIAGSTPKKNILLIHGVTYSSHVFNVDISDYSFVKFLARKGYAVWQLDLTGYGRSDKVSDGFKVNSDYAAEDIKSAVEKINAESLDLLGWSVGTVLAAKFTAKYPQKVNKLILYAPIFNGIGAANVTEPFHKNTWEHAAEDFQKLTNGEINFSIVEPEVANTFISNCLRYDKDFSPNGLRRELLTSKNNRLIFMEQIKNPVLIIEGNRDTYINRALLNEIAESLPGYSEVVEIAGGSHIVMIEKPYYKKFRDAVIKFLEK